MISRTHDDPAESHASKESDVQPISDVALCRMKVMVNLEYQAAMRELHSISLETLRLDFADDKNVTRFRDIIQSVCAIVARM